MSPGAPAVTQQRLCLTRLSTRRLKLIPHDRCRAPRCPVLNAGGTALSFSPRRSLHSEISDGREHRPPRLSARDRLVGRSTLTLGRSGISSADWSHLREARKHWSGLARSGRVEPSDERSCRLAAHARAIATATGRSRATPAAWTSASRASRSTVSPGLGRACGASAHAPVPVRPAPNRTAAVSGLRRPRASVAVLVLADHW
jgi:hypothetical protein